MSHPVRMEPIDELCPNCKQDNLSKGMYIPYSGKFNEKSYWMYSCYKCNYQREEEIERE
jgi:C4-type Zn-finger protein